MKFQNCILINFERTYGRMDGRMEGRTDKPKAICPFNFSKVGGIKTDPSEIERTYKFRKQQTKTVL